MFINRLYHHSKVLFFAFVLFVIAFIYLNLKWGAVATPVYQYGMFSGVMKKNSNTVVYSFYSNDSLLDLSNAPFPVRDKIMVGLQRYLTHKIDNAAIYFMMKRLLSAVGIGSCMSEEKYTIRTSDEDFQEWLINNIQKKITLPVDSLSVYASHYNWMAQEMIMTGKPLKLPIVGAER